METNIRNLDHPLTYQTPIDAVEGQGWLRRKLQRTNESILITLDEDGYYLSHRPFAQNAEIAKEAKKKKEPQQRRQKTYFDKVEDRIAYLYGIGHSPVNVAKQVRVNKETVLAQINSIVLNCTKVLTDEQKSEITTEYLKVRKVSSQSLAYMFRLPYHLVVNHIATLSHTLRKAANTHISDELRNEVKRLFEMGTPKSQIIKKLNTTHYLIYKILGNGK